MTFRLNLDELSTPSPEAQSPIQKKLAPFVITPVVSIPTTSGWLTFVGACELINTHKPNYKVILRYKSDQKWSFKFEKGAQQYDAIELLFLLTEGEQKFKQNYRFDARWNNLKMSTKNKVVFHNLAHGQGFGNYHDTYRECFTRITGIECKPSKAYDSPRFPDTCEDSDVRAVCGICAY